VVDLGRGFGTIELGHGKVHHDDVRMELAHFSNCLEAVGCAANHLNIPFGLEQHAQAVANNRVIVDEENRDRHIYKLTWTRMRVPRPAADSTRSAPPADSARSFMIIKPQPRWLLSCSSTTGSKPQPSSATHISKDPGRDSSESVTR